jgi:hypothetical protein
MQPALSSENANSPPATPNSERLGRELKDIAAKVTIRHARRFLQPRKPSRFEGKAVAVFREEAAAAFQK